MRPKNQTTAEAVVKFVTHRKSSQSVRDSDHGLPVRREGNPTTKTARRASGLALNFPPGRPRTVGPLPNKSHEVFTS